MTHKLLQFTAFPLERLCPQRLFILMGMIYQDLRAGKTWEEGIVLGDCEADWFRALAAWILLGLGRCKQGRWKAMEVGGKGKRIKLIIELYLIMSETWRGWEEKPTPAWEPGTRTKIPKEKTGTTTGSSGDRANTNGQHWIYHFLGSLGLGARWVCWTSMEWSGLWSERMGFIHLSLSFPFSWPLTFGLLILLTHRHIHTHTYG